MRTGRGIPRRRGDGLRASRFADDGDPLTSPTRDGKKVAERSERRRSSTLKNLRGAGVLPLPEIVFRPARGLSKKDRDEQIALLGASGAAVRVVEPDAL